jgi:hypothetical protein
MLLKRIMMSLALITLAVFGQRASQAQSCNSQSLRGAFGYSVSGTITSAIGPLAPGAFAAVGKIQFDGYGHVTTVRTLSDNGVVLQADQGTGTYVLNSDCTGSFNISVGPAGHQITLNLNIVLDDTGQLRGIVTNTGTVLLFEGRRQLPLFY